MAEQQAALVIIVSVKKTDATVKTLRKHIESVLPENVVKEYHLALRKGKKVNGRIILKDPGQIKNCARLLRTSTLSGQPVSANVAPATVSSPQKQEQSQEATKESSNGEGDRRSKWDNAKPVASKFFYWLHQGDYSGVKNGASVNLISVTRDTVHELFTVFARKHSEMVGKQQRGLEGLVMSILRSQKLAKTKRYSDSVVICSFSRLDKTFAPIEERKTARDKIQQQRKILVSDKGGIQVDLEPTTDPSNTPALPVNQLIKVWFPMTAMERSPPPIKLTNVFLSGSHKKDYEMKTRLPCKIPAKFEMSFRARNTGVYRVNVLMTFRNSQSGERFDILRNVMLRAGDSDLHDMLKAETPYVKKERKADKPVDKKNVLGPPKEALGGPRGYTNLQFFKVPLDVRQMVESREIEASLLPPDFDTSDEDLEMVYSSFWQNLIWISELQAYEDIKLFDMENATLQRSGRLFKLYVSGLAEGRPSILRGDIILCNWKGKQYQGRVVAVELLDVMMIFHQSFHQDFNVNLDRVDLIRFTFSRTVFRTSHAGCLEAPKTMGPSMLLPQPEHIIRIHNQQHQRTQRVLPNEFKWASPLLNDEQRSAVKNIAQGTLRPMPYIIFGPPGTGKTTTITETVYQLARLHTYNRSQEKLRILLIAPSNDATDILVEKLSQYFPPSEMMRVLAFTRSVDQCPPLVQPYVRKDLGGEKLLSEMMSVQIVVSTVNLAARFWCSGKGFKKGLFDCICVDEAGHATEPEVIGAIATLMKFSGENTGQLVLAGDPKQLGPIITSDLCKKFGMGMSYMERLVNKSPAYSLNDSGEYPSELATLLVRNYRSHPAILKLPNEMFYHNKLLPCGDKLTTHSMVKWEHLPNIKAGFPIIFQSVDGENQREGDSPSWFNPQEAILVVETASLLVKRSRPPIRQDEIGIITPYARQVQKIRLLLKAKDMGDIKVGSVETFQGQERRCIIISTVRSENSLLEHDRKYNLGFVANEKRFNVAVTRAKALLFIIGNPRVLQTDKKNWLPLLRYCRDNESWVGEEWDESAAGAEEDIADEALANMVENMTLGDDKEASIDPLTMRMKEMVLGAEVNGAEEAETDDGWAVVTDQEARGFINREE